MDHPITFRREIDWRRTAMVASAFAALELLFILAVGMALLAKPLTGGSNEPRAVAAVKKAASTVASKPATPTPPPPPAAPQAKPRGETSVLVLNGNGSAGAAAEKADLVQTKGYLIAGTANAPRTDFASSVVMFRPGHKAEAVRFGKDFGIARVTPLDGLRVSELEGAHVVLIVGES